MLLLLLPYPRLRCQGELWGVVMLAVYNKGQALCVACTCLKATVLQPGGVADAHSAALALQSAGS